MALAAGPPGPTTTVPNSRDVPLLAGMIVVVDAGDGADEGGALGVGRQRGGRRVEHEALGRAVGGEVDGVPVADHEHQQGDGGGRRTAAPSGAAPAGRGRPATLPANRWRRSLTARRRPRCRRRVIGAARLDLAGQAGQGQVAGRAGDPADDGRRAVGVDDVGADLDR